MNCNNLGNYFTIVGHEREVTEDKSSFIMGKTHYPKGHCYKVRNCFGTNRMLRYSEAIDYLFPEDYIRWKEIRFGIKNEI
jgi:hypothetical protein